MRNIEIFYHFYVVPDQKLGEWTWWVDQQLGLIKSSGLADLASVSMGITCPRFWTHMYSIPFMLDNTIEVRFEDKVREYISWRYPFVKTFKFRDVNELNIYEAHTLGMIFDRCQQPGEFDCLYIHNKGAVSGFTPAIANWREILNYYHIELWARCINELKTHDVVGIKDAKTTPEVTSGNFWWAKSEYLRKLPDPLLANQWVNDSNLTTNDNSYNRYAFEKWISRANPNMKYLVDTKTDHYMQYCFLEDFKLKHPWPLPFR